MPKVKAVGDILFEFEVKHNQTVDLFLQTKAITVDNTTIYIAKGNIAKINPKAFGFIADRMEYFVKRSNAYPLNVLAPLTKSDTECKLDYHLINVIHNEQIEPLKTIILACRFDDPSAIDKMLQDGCFILSKRGIKKYVEHYIEQYIEHLSSFQNN